MKKILIFSLLVIVMFSTAFAAGGKHHKSSHFFGTNCTMDNVDIDMDDGTLVMTHRDYDEPIVEITEDHELYINGKKIKID